LGNRESSNSVTPETSHVRISLVLPVKTRRQAVLRLVH
jgi:hypothetical protein